MLPRFFCCLIGLLFAAGLIARTTEVVLPDVKAREADGILWVALDAGPGFGSSVVELANGGRVFLAFQADCLLRIEEGSVAEARLYRDYQWQSAARGIARLDQEDGGLALRLMGGHSLDRVRAVQWFSVGRDGRVATDGRRPRQTAGDDVYLPRYYAVDGEGGLEARGRFGRPTDRPRIYQMLPRLFGNENERRKVNGTLRENGSGKFSDLSGRVLEQFKEDGFTHLWLTGVLQQATSTDYPEAGQPADDPDLLKGIAGSPYAIKDYFDVSPDFAEDPEDRLAEFRALTERMRAAGLKVVIDFVPNHVARSYRSDIRPELSFGEDDRKDRFFHPDNNFFYLTPDVAGGGPPLRLPTVDPGTGEVLSESARLVGGADGLFAPERKHGRVTGNNVVSWQPPMGAWYETVKLNYGFDFLDRDRRPEYPSAVTPDKPIPDTWTKMDGIIAYWQEIGVDGFRADMAHMVPPEFWKWVIHRAKQRDPEVFFYAEAYNDDPAKVPSREPVIGEDTNVMVALLDAGFHAVYDDPGYDTLEHLYTQVAWANDLQDVEQGLGPFFFDNAVRYAENHDEIRLAHPESWGGLGMEVGKPVTGTLFGLSRGPVMLYHGQEVGEPALGREGFGGDDQRTTIFDYWSMPELNKWWNAGAADGAGLSLEQSELRAWYMRLLQLQAEPAFTMGDTVFLNHANLDNALYGRVDDVDASAHWFFAYLRAARGAESRFLVATNFHSDATLRHLRLRLPQSAVEMLGLEDRTDAWLLLHERLNDDCEKPLAIPVADALRDGIYLEEMGPLRTDYWELEVVEEPGSGATRAPAPRTQRGGAGDTGSSSVDSNGATASEGGGSLG